MSQIYLYRVNGVKWGYERKRAKREDKGKGGDEKTEHTTIETSVKLATESEGGVGREDSGGGGGEKVSEK